jgi:hypothetical protein
MIPILISGWPNLAVSDAMMKSHIMASSQPPPRAKPDTAAITGLRTRSIVSQLRVMKPLCTTSRYSSLAMAEMSAPAANAFSLPVTTMQPMPSSASKASRAAPSSSISASFSALSCLGRFSVIRPVRCGPSPRVSMRMFS